MTPELKTACEVVFQEHKVSANPIKWDRGAFRGRISIGLSEMAKETLIKKKIIFLPDKSKKIITLLNPAVVAAASFEEAEDMIGNNVQTIVASLPDDAPSYIVHKVSGLGIAPSVYADQLLPVAVKSETRIAGIKWYMKPFFYYIVWPFCALMAGALIVYLLGLAYTKLFLNLR
jgi:hypothetical protein